MWKKVVLLLVTAVFLIGASGGCFSGGVPYLAGNWKGTFNSGLLKINGTVEITGLVQDQNGNFTSGTLTVIYKPNPSDASKDIRLSAPITPSDSKTDEWQATIVSNRTISPSIQLGATTISNYTFTFTFVHFYGCIGGDTNKLTGGYILTTGSQTVDSGTVDITKQ
ncbi:MAG: hypothetical protein ACP5PC_03270 [bacterium]